MWEYTDKVKEYFKNPKNVGEIENPDAVGDVGSIVCGDALRLTLRIDRVRGTITDAKFQTFGCGSAIASSSALTEMIKGKTIEAAAKVTNKDIADFLGGLPEEKMHCSVMGMEALEAALANYRGAPVHHEVLGAEEKLVCKCFGVSDLKILRAIKENNLKTVDEVTNYTKAGGGCGKCKPDIEALLKEFWEKEATKAKGALAPPPKKLTNLQRIALIQETIDREIRPGLKSDGGDIEILDIDRSKVFVRLLGTCLGCPSTGVTLKAFVESKLREFVEDDIVVEEVRE